MKNENELNSDLKQLLDTLEEHGRNARRQAQLSDLIDSLAEEEKTVEQPQKHRKLIPLWWAMGAAAAVLLFWLLFKPGMEQTPDTEERHLVEKMETTDTIKAEANDAIVEEPVVVEELLAEETPAVPQKTPIKMEKPRMIVVEEVAEEPVLAEVIPTTPATPNDTEIIVSNTIPTVNNMPSVVQRPQRRVVQSLNLVCYECQTDPQPEIKPNVENRTFFGQPQDPHMKNGALAFEFKLN